ncbi:MAG: phenylalanine--tRNA ligase subunit beta [Acutalibacteraceae bacterium]|nr:phenylalanine--tRNA ligase subunit beta [Acutalibacteraceae bacterium]
MFISMNWIREYVDLSGLDINKLINQFSLSTAEVENEIFYKGSDLEGIVVAEIKSVEDHPNSKKLHLLKVDIGADELVDVVCGAANVRVGMKTAFAKVGARIGEITIAPRPLAGFMSHGMCCSEKEIGISDDNAGIMDLDSDLPNGKDLKEIFDIDDIVFEVDNKSLTNRPDLWGHYGIAREFAALSGRELKPLDVVNLADYSSLPSLDIKIENDDCLRYSGLKFDNVSVKVSPMNMRIRLFYCQMRAINFLADMTNYVMLETGQPMHAFDSRKVEKIRIKKFDNAFKFTTLDSVERSIDENTLMICNDNEPVAIAGIMGGLDSEIVDDTTALTLESACFDPVSIRKSAARLSHHTDASKRYEKTLDPELTVTAIARFVKLLTDIDNGAKVISSLTDDYKRSYECKTISITKAYVDRYTGIGDAITNEHIEKTLKALGFEVEADNGNFTVKVPSWRATKDVTLKADLIEEITRIYGYDNFVPYTAKSALYPVRAEQEKSVDDRLKDIFVKNFKLHELHSYIWAYHDDYKKLGIEVCDNVKILNATNPNLETLRRSIVPTQLCQVKINTGYAPSFGVFEIGRVVNGLKEDGLCDERKMLTITLFSKQDSVKDLYFKLRDMIAVAVNEIKHREISFNKLEATESYQHPKNLNSIVCNDITLGEIGIVHPAISKKIDKKAAIVYAELDVAKICQIENMGIHYEEASKYPGMEVDLTFMADSYAPIKSAIDSVDSSLLKKTNVVDVYVDDEGKAITIRLVFSCKERTLTREDVQAVVDEIIAKLAKDNINLKS